MRFAAESGACAARGSLAVTQLRRSVAVQEGEAEMSGAQHRQRESVHGPQQRGAKSFK